MANLYRGEQARSLGAARKAQRAQTLCTGKNTSLDGMTIRTRAAGQCMVTPATICAKQLYIHETKEMLHTGLNITRFKHDSEVMAIITCMAVAGSIGTKPHLGSRQDSWRPTKGW